MTNSEKMIHLQMRHRGHAVRYHNNRYPPEMVILQDIVKDVISYEKNRPKGRSAAQNHFLCLLTLGTTVEKRKASAKGDGNRAKVAAWPRCAKPYSDSSISLKASC